MYKNCFVFVFFTKLYIIAFSLFPVCLKGFLHYHALSEKPSVLIDQLTQCINPMCVGNLALLTIITSFLPCPSPECRCNDDLFVRIYNTVSGFEPCRKVGNSNSIVHPLLALHSTMNVTPPDKTASELLNPSLQALGLIVFFTENALGLIKQAMRQIWLVQSKLLEACRKSLCKLLRLPGQIFGSVFLQWSLVPSTLSAV